MPEEALGSAMTETAFNAVVRRDRAIVIAAIITVSVLAWGYTLWLAAQMEGIETLASLAGMVEMDIEGMNAAPSPAFGPWNISDIVFISTMWAVMMVGMMAPSVTVMVVLHAAVARKTAASSRPLVASVWFLAGYLATWIVFSFAACGAQWILMRFGLLTSIGVSGTLGGLLLIGAGLYQWSSLKDICLKQCQKPFDFIMRHGGIRLEPFGALRLGAVHGLYCVGCCWVLMALLFVGGIMNVLWVAGLTMLIVMEKVAPTGTLIPRLAGALMVAAGLLLLAF